MTKPIEIIHQNFETKLNTVEEILDRVDPNWQQNLENHVFLNLKQEYIENATSILCDYFLQYTSAGKCAVVERYMQMIISKDFITKLNEFVSLVKFRISKTKMDIETQLLFKTFANTSIDTDVRRTDYKECGNCKNRMVLDPQHSELRCQKCDYTLVLKGTVFDESHMYTADGVLAKRGAYETSRHCRDHLDRILAIKNPNMPDEVWEKIQMWIQRNNFEYPKKISYADYRRCLKEIKETRWNEHVPFIRQSISGISPKRLYHNEVQLLLIYFDKAVTAFNKIKEGERANLKYYPYFIFKIIEMILCKPEDSGRLKSIIDCIHFQRDNTIVANDRLWASICNEVPEFCFKKTDKNLHQD